MNDNPDIVYPRPTERNGAMFHCPITMFVLVSGLSIAACGDAAAESTKAEGPAAVMRPQSLQDTKALTGKARLGNKWTDEQRLNNCKVPIDKRGDKPRSDACKSDQPVS
jgi:hypothetical protein